MANIKILHNPRCRKSREALEILQNSQNEIEIVDYLKSPLTEEQLNEVLLKLGIKAEELIRKGEEVYKTEFKGKKLNDEDWVKAMVAYPKLMERPVVISGDKAVIGRPPEKVKDIL